MKLNLDTLFLIDWVLGKAESMPGIKWRYCVMRNRTKLKDILGDARKVFGMSKAFVEFESKVQQASITDEAGLIALAEKFEINVDEFKKFIEDKKLLLGKEEEVDFYSVPIQSLLGWTTPLEDNPEHLSVGEMSLLFEHGILFDEDVKVKASAKVKKLAEVK
jgi:hypothetical protein